jgi:hypothetical protein
VAKTDGEFACLLPSECPDGGEQFDHEEAGEYKANDAECVERFTPSWVLVALLASEEIDNEVYVCALLSLRE